MLAGELSRCANVAGAFDAYERAMRPFVERAQDVPRIGPRLMHPRSRTGIRLLHAALRMATTPLLRRVMTRVFVRTPPEPDLSPYAA